MNAMVWLSVRVPDEAYTAPILGSERGGNGCVIGNDGQVLTIGYLMTEAQTIWITDHRGRTVPGHAVGVDFASGLALVLPAMPLDVPALARGRSAELPVGDGKRCKAAVDARSSCADDSVAVIDTVPRNGTGRTRCAGRAGVLRIEPLSKAQRLDPVGLPSLSQLGQAGCAVGDHEGGPVP